MLLLDNIDALPGIQQLDELLKPLKTVMSPFILETQGMITRYFLPTSIEQLLTAQPTIYRLDHCDVSYIHWLDHELKGLIKQRLIYFSQDQFAPYTSVGQLCDNIGGFAESVDQELVTLAEGNPRAIIWLTNRLIQLHCQNPDSSRLIAPETWEQVRLDWWLQRRKQILTEVENQDEFRLLGERIYFRDQEIILPERYHALLHCLVRWRGKVCTKNELVRAGWSDEEPEGVSDRALSEAIRRLKHALEQQDIDPEWVHNVHGRGYRINNPTEK